MPTQRAARRVVFPDGTWLNFFGDGTTRLSSYRHTFRIREVIARRTGSHIEMEKSTKTNGTSPNPLLRKRDYAVIPAGDLTAVQRAKYFRDGDDW